MKKFILKTFVFLISAVSANAQWQADDRLTIDSAISKTSYNNASSVAANESNVHVVWYDNRHGNYEIFYKRSTDDGVSWGTDTRLTNNFASSTTPSVSAVGQLVHVIWEEFRDGNSEIYYKRSSNGGSHWGADIRLTTNSFSSRYPSLSVSGHKIHVVWNDDRNGSGNNEIYYKRSTDAGQSWGTDTRLTNNSHFSYFPTISVYQENVHVAWNDNRDGHMEIYYKRSTDGGLFWGPDTRITSYSSNPSSNSISASGPHVHLTYIDQRNSQTKVYYKRSPDGGTSWGPETSLSINYQDCVNPYIVASGQSVHFVYQY
jgi:hypothetical protein